MGAENQERAGDSDKSHSVPNVPSGEPVCLFASGAEDRGASAEKSSGDRAGAEYWRPGGRDGAVQCSDECSKAAPGGAGGSKPADL